MANKVFANNREIACKSSSGKSICAFPDTCWTPPQTPGSPMGIPIPYPNTAFASDTSSGTKKVKLHKKEVLLKNKSFFKKSTGNEAGRAPKKGLITSKNTGKAYFCSWSMDVKFEGLNVARQLDMTTHNHGCTTSNTPITYYMAQKVLNKSDSCKDDRQKIKENCHSEDDLCPGALGQKFSATKADVAKNEKPLLQTAKKMRLTLHTVTSDKLSRKASSSKCASARRCFLRPFTKSDNRDGKKSCCPGQTPHHIPPKKCFKKSSGGYIDGYDDSIAICVCLEGTTQHHGSHGLNHALIDEIAAASDVKKEVSIDKYNSICAKAVAIQCNCDEGCIKNQLDASLAHVGLNNDIQHGQLNSRCAKRAQNQEVLAKARADAKSIPGPIR